MAHFFEPIPVDVQMEGRPDPVRVMIDQRDLARAEAEGLDADTTKRLTRTRFLAWSAAKRAGVTTKPWPEFNESECVLAEVAPEFYKPEDGDPPAEPLNPGRMDQNAGA